MASEEDNIDHTSPLEDIHNKPSTSSRFRFKTKRHHDQADDADRPRKRRRSSPSHSHRHHSHKRPKPSKDDRHSKDIPDDPSLYDDTHIPNARSSSDLDPDTAFRESLFDALADDEGAAYWEGVYGQPIHTYSPLRPGPQGELEHMTDDEYAAYVRASMYVKTHQHVIEERQKREKERLYQETLEKMMFEADLERVWFQKEVEESLKRGEQRKLKSKWRGKWEGYILAWESLNIGNGGCIDPAIVGGDDTAETVHGKEAASKRKMKRIRDEIPWPVESGRFADVNKDAIEDFFRRSAEVVGADLLATLKVERVRWHPDKVQQRLAAIPNLRRIEDEATMRKVTAVFQVIDRLWNEEKERK